MMIPKARRIRLHGKELRELCVAVWRRDGGKCIACGRNVPEGAKPHHFPQGALKSDEIGCMVTMCDTCHKLAHFGINGEVGRYKKICRDYLESVKDYAE